jgi:hypothetical protein
LASIALLELVARLRDQGYFVTIENFLDAESMHDVARGMEKVRA